MLIQRKYLLRPAFEYFDGRVWRGQWNQSGPALSDTAIGQTKTGMIFAIIEGKNIVTRQIDILASCRGDIFDNFEWFAVSSIPIGKIVGSVTPRTENIGLVLVTKEHRISVGMDGSTKIEVREN